MLIGTAVMRLVAAISGAAALLAFGYSPSAAASGDKACLAAPDVACAIGQAHAAAAGISRPAERAVSLIRIAALEAEAGYGDQADATIALARAIADAPGLVGEGAEGEFGPRSDAEARAMLYARMIESLARSGADVAVLRQMAEEAAADPSWRFGLYYSAAQALIGADRNADARILIELAAESRPDGPQSSDMLFALAQLYVQIGDLETALAISDDLPQGGERAMARYGLMTQIAREQRQNGDEEAAAAIESALRDELASVEDPQAREMLELMLPTIGGAGETGGAISKPSGGGCRADLSPYGMAVSLAKLGYYEAAIAEALQIDEPVRRDGAFGRVASYQSKAGDLYGAQGTAMMIGDDDERNFALSEIAQAHAAAGAAAEAEAVTAAITGDEYRTMVLSQLIEPLVVAENVTGAARIAHGFSDDRVRVDAFATLAEAMLAAERTEQEAEAGSAHANPTVIE